MSSFNRADWYKPCPVQVKRMVRRITCTSCGKTLSSTQLDMHDPLRPALPKWNERQNELPKDQRAAKTVNVFHANNTSNSSQACFKTQRILHVQLTFCYNASSIRIKHARTYSGTQPMPPRLLKFNASNTSHICSIPGLQATSQSTHELSTLKQCEHQAMNGIQGQPK